MNQRTYVGLDIHARSVVGCAIDERTGEITRQRLAANNAGIACVVAAPSKLQRPPGDRVKTDARDAEHLARLNLLDQITAVAVPDTAREAARDLVRAREDVRSDLMRSRHRLSKLLLRHGIIYSGGSAWTNAHHTWLHQQHFEDASLQATYETCLETVELTLDRRDRLDARITTVAETEPYAEVVHALMCLRGISVLTAFGLTVEVGDWNRFTGKTIGAFLGLVPSEHSSGASRSQGSITKTGNTHARRLLVEAAWHHRRNYQPTREMQARWDKASEASRIRGHQGNHRLHDQWEKFETRKKRRVIANVAIAREMAGWCWSLAAPVQREHPWPAE